MERLYLPYSGEGPTVVSVNGHRLVILAQEAEQVSSALELLGGDSVQEFDVESYSDPIEFVQEIALATKAEVVMAPPNANLGLLVKELHEKLPWIQ